MGEKQQGEWAEDDTEHDPYDGQSIDASRHPSSRGAESDTPGR